MGGLIQIPLEVEQVEYITTTRLSELMNELDQPATFGIDPWQAAYVQDALMDVLQLMLTDKEYKTLWGDRNGLCTDARSM
jgi:hypothetical protein